jgi:acyl-CoA dehydrogenase
MMTFQSSWMNDDLRMFRKTVRQFIEEKFAPHHARWCQQHRPDPEAWTAAGATTPARMKL